MNKHYAKLGLFIDGEWITDRRVKSPVINPADGGVLADLPHATADDIDRALMAAKKGFETWRELSLSRRIDILTRAVAIIRSRADIIASTLTLEQGKPLADARSEVMRTAALIEWDCQEARRTYGRIIPAEAGFQSSVLKFPIGPVAAFSPWNFPASIVGRKLSALAAGCSVVLKAAEETPGTACEIVRCFEEAGLPPGVLNLVFGDPAAISRQLISSDIIRAVTLTGSVPVGKKVAALAAQHMKPAIMELGGHSPVIVCADADVATAARNGAVAKFRNAGQICTAPTRFIVQDEVFDTFATDFIAKAGEVKVGDGFEAGVTMGPLSNDRRISEMEQLVGEAVAKGAKLALGGKRIGNRGFFFEPTVLTDVPLDARIMNEEPFGPVALLVRYRTLDDAISIANSTSYGLASYAFTSSADSAALLAEQVESGIMSINHFGGSQPEAPFGGVKESGTGREGGSEGLDAFMVTKFVSQKISGRL